MINYFSYTSQGTGFNTGISVGSFTIPGNVSRGIPINQPQFYRIAPKQAGEIVASTVQSFDNTVGSSYYKLSTFNNTRANLVEVPFGNRALWFDVPRTVKFELSDISGTPDVTIIVSYIDQFGQIGRRQSNDFDSNVSYFPVGVLGITAVEVIKNAGNTASFKITMSTTNKFELIYNDYGSPSTFMWICKNNVNEKVQVPLFRNIDENSPFLFQADITDSEEATTGYTPASQLPQTLTTGQPRPLIDFDNFTLETNQTISVVQNVLGIGMNSDGLPSIVPRIETISSSQEVIFGQKNYTEGFTAWQG